MRYFLELSYIGTSYSGFQVQENANTVQAEMEKAIAVLLKEKVALTGSSRTDAGVHAWQNYFHFDTAVPIENKGLKDKQQFVYKLNAILPPAIAVRSLQLVNDKAHSRFDAIYREYNYYLSTIKNPFIQDRAYYFPYKVDMELMQSAAGILKEYTDFTSFSKRNTQAKTFICHLAISEWEKRGSVLVYKVRGDRFLRGMVRALTSTMLNVGRKKTNLEEFRKIIEARDCSKASFAVPAHGLFLMKVEYPAGLQPSVG